MAAYAEEGTNGAGANVHGHANNRIGRKNVPAMSLPFSWAEAKEVLFSGVRTEGDLRETRGGVPQSPRGEISPGEASRDEEMMPPTTAIPKPTVKAGCGVITSRKKPRSDEQMRIALSSASLPRGISLTFIP